MLMKQGSRVFPLTAALCCWFILQWTVRFSFAAEPASHLQRAAVFLLAADYRQAVEALPGGSAGVSPRREVIPLTYVPCASTDMLSSWRVPISGCASNRCT